MTWEWCGNATDGWWTVHQRVQDCCRHARWRFLSGLLHAWRFASSQAEGRSRSGDVAAWASHVYVRGMLTIAANKPGGRLVVGRLVVQHDRRPGSALDQGELRPLLLRRARLVVRGVQHRTVRGVAARSKAIRRLNLRCHRDAVRTLAPWHSKRIIALTAA